MVIEVGSQQLSISAGVGCIRFHPLRIARCCWVDTLWEAWDLRVPARAREDVPPQSRGCCPTGLFAHNGTYRVHSNEEICREVPRLIDSSCASPARNSTTEEADRRGSERRRSRMVMTDTTCPFFATNTTSSGYLIPKVWTAAHLVIQSAPSSDPVPSRPVFLASRVSATHSGTLRMPSTRRTAGARSGAQVGQEGSVITAMLPEKATRHAEGFSR